jgi:hypothetical protein
LNVAPDLASTSLPSMSMRRSPCNDCVIANLL